MTITRETISGKVSPALKRLRRRERRDHLLDVRTQLAETAACYRAHGLDEHAEELAVQQYAVEATIREEFPEVYARDWPQWVGRDAELMHDAMALSPNCPVCQAIAKRGGVNLTAPEAA